jgi:hypothetical protein
VTAKAGRGEGSGRAGIAREAILKSAAEIRSTKHDARRGPVNPRNDRPERVYLRRFEPLETFASLPYIDAIPS